MERAGDGTWPKATLPPACYDSIEEYRNEEMNNKDLLIRIDERTQNIWKVLEQLETHQKEANGYIRDNMKSTARNTTWIAAMRWVMGIMIAGGATWLAHLQGFW